jgi:SAM-dependent methyltransferase
MNNQPDIISPVTGKAGVKPFNSIDVKDIIRLYRQEHDLDVSEYFIGMDTVPIMECQATGYRFYYPSTVAGNAVFYEHFQQKNINNEDWYRKWGYDYQLAYDNIEKNESVLDIGCGTGEFLKKIREKTGNAVGLELNSVAYDKCIKAGLTVYNETIQAYAANNRGKYDVVCIFQVLEHVYDIKDFLDAALKALKPGGKLVIGVPNNEPYFQGYDKHSTLNLPPHHVGLWNKKALSNLQGCFGIRMEKLVYDKKGGLVADAYYRAKYSLGITTEYRRHSRTEKIKLMLLSPFMLPLSIFGGMHSGFVAALYRKS